MVNDAEQVPTHRIHWRVACDAHIIGRGFQIARTHEARVRQAEFCYHGGLIPERCTFGPRRLVLEGEVDYVPPKWHPSRPSAYGQALAENVARWTLRQLYGMGDRGRFLDEEPEPRNMRIEVRVRPIAEAA